MNKIVVTLFLVVCSYLDIKYRKIPVSVYFGFAFISVVMAVCGDMTNPVVRMVGMLPGIVMIVVSFISREKIGYGDSVAITLIGILYGYKMILSMCVVGFGIVFMTGLIMLITGKAGLYDRLPFMPFLMAGNVWAIVAGVI